MYAQCNLEENENLLLDMLVDYQKDDKEIPLTDQHITAQSRSVTFETTAGWQICCQWKEVSTSWEKLSELRESHPVQTAKFGVSQGIDHEPAFKRWVRPELKKSDRITASIRKQ